MHRTHLVTMLERYQRRYPADAARVDQMIQFVEGHADCFLRSCMPGHITGAAWLVSADGARCVLTHHRKLNCWLQPGGHADGEPEVHRVALREAQEESGMWDLQLADCGGTIEPLDIDIHTIPRYGVEPEHLHYDVRFLVIAADGQEPRASPESHEVRWFTDEELRDLVSDESVLRMARRARAKTY